MSKLEQQLDQFLHKGPTLGQGVYIARSAVVLGDVTLGDYASIWYGAVLRGDINRIEIGHHTNIQDNTVVHLTDDLPCIVGQHVTVGHAAILHACTIGNEVLVGMGSAILDGAVVGDQCLIGARALVTPGSKIPPGSMVLGMPAKVVRPLTDDERGKLKNMGDKYAAYAAYCLAHQFNVGAPLRLP